MDTTDLALVEEALQHSGLNAALRALNSRVDHRFTAVYKLEEGFLRNVAIVDKLGEVVPDLLLKVPFEQSFCQFVLRDGVFLTADSARDDRLNGHPFKGVMGSYVGLPIASAGGDLFGTFCHFDFPVRDLSATEYAFLERAVRLLPAYVIS